MYALAAGRNQQNQPSQTVFNFFGNEEVRDAACVMGSVLWDCGGKADALHSLNWYQLRY